MKGICADTKNIVSNRLVDGQTTGREQERPVCPQHIAESLQLKGE
jgi:hypothetical protein